MIDRKEINEKLPVVESVKKEQNVGLPFNIPSRTKDPQLYEAFARSFALSLIIHGAEEEIEFYERIKQKYLSHCEPINGTEGSE
jgi:hypothetical protein